MEATTSPWHVHGSTAGSEAGRSSDWFCLLEELQRWRGCYQRGVPCLVVVLPGVWLFLVPPSRNSHLVVSQSRAVFCRIWSTMELGVWAVIWSQQSGINVPMFSWSGILELTILRVLLQFEGSLFKFCLIESFVTIWVFSTICGVTIWVDHNLSFAIICQNWSCYTK